MNIFPIYRRVTALLALLVLALSAMAQSHPETGKGNDEAGALGHRSPMVQSSYQFLLAQARRIGNPTLRRETLDALGNDATCIRHRAGLTEADRARIVRELIDAGLADPKDDTTFSGGLQAGVFPPILDDGGPCPHLPQKFYGAPGGSFGSHHSWPGGLAVHEATNEISALNLAREYRQVHGHSSNGFATLDPVGPAESPKSRTSDILIDQDIIIGAPLWHDWAKAIVFQWNGDGSEFAELEFGGAARTGAHHILGLAETMKRGFSPAFVIAQASAHAVPSLGSEYKVVSWLRAAAIIAQVDPFAKGYLIKDSQGKPQVPGLRAEYALHNLSDGDFTYSIPAVTSAQTWLQQLAPEFGFNPSDRANYNIRYRNPALSFMTAERMLMIFNEKGIDAIRRDLQKLKAGGVFGPTPAPAKTARNE